MRIIATLFWHGVSRNRRPQKNQWMALFYGSYVFFANIDCIDNERA